MRILLGWRGVAGCLAMGSVIGGTTPSCLSTKEQVDTVLVEKGDVESTALLSGRVEASQQKVINAPYDCVIKKLLVKVGQTIEAGVPLLEIDPKTVLDRLRAEQTRMVQLQSRISNMKIQSDQLQKNIDKSRKLLANRVIASVEMEKQVSDLAVIKNDMQGVLTEAALVTKGVQDLQRQVSDTVIRAPIKGIVTATWVPADQFVSGSAVKLGENLVTISSGGELTLRSTVLEVDILRFNQGMPVTVSIPGLPGETWEGRIVQIDEAAVIDKGSGQATFRVVSRFPSNGKPIKTGMEARAFAVLDRREGVLKIPRAALKRTGRKGFVMVQKGDAFVKTPVEIGVIGDVDVEISKGLNQNDVIAAVFGAGGTGS